MTQRWEHAALLENLNSRFRLQVDGSDELELELTEVSELRVAQRQEFFSVEFRCRSNSVLVQRIYRLKHERLGESDLFLVPIRKDDQGVYYEAVFNRLFDDSESSGAIS
jgi:hypothetical protein